MRKAHDLAKEEEDRSFNCWGATLFILDQVNELYWVEEADMIDFLHNYTEPNKGQLEVGDILVLYEKGRFKESKDILVHTAVYIGKGRFWHKKGMTTSSFDTLEAINEIYFSNYYEIRRMKRRG